MASSGSSPESNRPHRRRDLGRTSRSRDTRPHIEEVDYDDDENNPLPSINPPPGTEIARGVPDPPQPSDTITGDTPHQTTTSHRAVSDPPSTPRPHHAQHPTPPFPPVPPPHLSGPIFPPPRVQAPRPRPPLSQPRATGPPPHNPYAPRPRPRQPLSSRDHRTSRTTRSPLTRQFDRRRSHPRSRSARSRRPREHRRRSPVASRSRRDNHHSRRSHSRHHRSHTHTTGRAGNSTLHRSTIVHPIFPQHVHGRVIPIPIVADHGQATTLPFRHLAPPHTAHPFHLQPQFTLLRIGTLRGRPLWYYYLR